jgi:hypothetical protein
MTIGAKVVTVGFGHGSIARSQEKVLLPVYVLTAFAVATLSFLKPGLAIALSEFER